MLISLLGQDEGFPGWLGPVVAAGVLAAVGYVGRLIVEEWRAWRTRRASDTASLVALLCLLDAGRVAFEVQANLRNRLSALLHERHSAVPDHGGYEQYFCALYDEFSVDEMELHRVIRGYTVHALRPVNEAVSQWLSADTTHRTHTGAKDDESELARLLNLLDAHLLLWHAKYAAWIPDVPAHALVYLADEEAHGYGFPRGIEDALRTVISRR